MCRCRGTRESWERTWKEEERDSIVRTEAIQNNGERQKPRTTEQVTSARTPTTEEQPQWTGDGGGDQEWAGMFELRLILNQAVIKKGIYYWGKKHAMEWI